ncbi:MAG: hypothetical protein WD824_26065 [Cyclobacteriaceae bacterium]
MFVPFQSMAPASRIWIFQANRPLSAAESAILERRLREFTEGWAAHGSPLKTSFTVKFDQFVILAADETHESPSGCSIDSSVRVLKDLEQSLGIQFFDRNQVAFKLGDQVILVPLQDLKQKFQDGILNEETLTFNNLVGMKSELEKAWLVPAGHTWLRRYIPNELANMK